MPTYLDFEKPIAELEGEIEELRHLDTGGDINIAEEVSKLQVKADRLLSQTYGKLTPWDKVQVARHPDRPHAIDCIDRLIEDFTPLAGDRAFSEDAAILGGLGRFRRRSRPWLWRRRPGPGQMGTPEKRPANPKAQGDAKAPAAGGTGDPAAPLTVWINGMLMPVLFTFDVQENPRTGSPSYGWQCRNCRA